MLFGCPSVRLGVWTVIVLLVHVCFARTSIGPMSRFTQIRRGKGRHVVRRCDFVCHAGWQSPLRKRDFAVPSFQQMEAVDSPRAVSAVTPEEVVRNVQNVPVLNMRCPCCYWQEQSKTARQAVPKHRDLSVVVFPFTLHSPDQVAVGRRVGARCLAAQVCPGGPPAPVARRRQNGLAGHSTLLLPMHMPSQSYVHISRYSYNNRPYNDSSTH